MQISVAVNPILDGLFYVHTLNEWGSMNYSSQVP